MIFVERAKKFLNAEEKHKYVSAEVKMITNTAKNHPRKIESLVKKMDGLDKKLVSFYNSYFSFILYKVEGQVAMSASCEFSSPYGTILFYPISFFFDIYVMSHALDRYEERCNKDFPPIEESIYCTNTVFDKFIRCILHHYSLGEVYYRRDGINSIHLKLGDYGVLAIERVNQVYLIKTFMTNDMVHSDNWMDIFLILSTRFF
jgi:hypothetical protein